MVEKSHTSGFWPTVWEPLSGFGSRVADWVAPASEASAKDDAYRISIELPGVDEKDIEVAIHDGLLTLKGEKKTSREEKGETWFFSERQYGSFSRSFRLPPDAADEGVEADLKDGVLTVTVPKSVPKTPPTAKVKIRTS